MCMTYYSTTNRGGTQKLQGCIVIEGASDQCASEANANAPPMMIVHSKDDPTVNYKHVPPLIKAFSNVGVDFRTLIYEKGSHSPWVFHTNNFYKQLQLWMWNPSNYTQPVDPDNQFNMFGWSMHTGSQHACYENFHFTLPPQFANTPACPNACEQVSGCTGMDSIGHIGTYKGDPASPNGVDCYLYSGPMCMNPQFGWTVEATTGNLTISNTCRYFPRQAYVCDPNTGILQSAGCKRAAAVLNKEWKGTVAC